MTGIVVSNVLRTSWKQILYWGVGLGLIGFYIVFIAADSAILEGYADLFESMPPGMLEAFGASSTDMLRTAEGWIVSIFVSESTLFLSAFAVMAGLNISANDEQSGIMDVVLSLPISRSSYILERWIGYALIALAIILVCTGITLLGIVTIGVDADTGAVFASMLNLYPGTLLVMTVTSLLTSVLRRRAVAIGIAVVFVVGSYISGIIGGMASGAIAELMKNLSYFSYAQGEEIVLGAYDPAGTIGLVLVVLIGFALSVKMFNGRDIGQ